MHIVPSNRDAEDFFHQGVTLMAEGDAARAEECFRRALQIRPDFGEACLNLGLLLEQQGETDQAEMAYHQALQLGATQPEVFLNLGGLALCREDFQMARDILTRGLHTHPDSAALWSNMGVLYACEKKEAQAESCYRTAMRQTPGHRSARFNLAYVLLRQGRYAEGFACFEARDWYAGLSQLLTESLRIPRWQGELLAGQSILITCEAGHGDMIQFCRYAAPLKAAGADRVDILCHPALRRVFATLPGADRIFVLGEDPGPRRWDFWTPAMSLPHFCGSTLDNLPADIPYLAASPADSARWLPRLPAGRPRVGLVWRGNPRFENDHHRSLAHFSVLAPLWSVAGIHFVSLQKGPGENEVLLPDRALPITSIGPVLEDFADTAGVLVHLDLLITVDTGIAHLAGAMGIPCWVLLPYYKTDWRWLQDREDSPWYPRGLRLFRQTAPASWDEVLTRVRAALEQFLTVQGSPPR